jgi:hypothetical protein
VLGGFDPVVNHLPATKVLTVPDVFPSSLKHDLKPQGLTFSGHSDTLKKDYHLELEFYAEIDPAESTVNHTNNNVGPGEERGPLNHRNRIQVLTKIGGTALLKKEEERQ